MREAVCPGMCLGMLGTSVPQLVAETYAAITDVSMCTRFLWKHLRKFQTEKYEASEMIKTCK
jgi:hypothetical protein